MSIQISKSCSTDSYFKQNFPPIMEDKNSYERAMSILQSQNEKIEEIILNNMNQPNDY
ncbi:Hypothetical protein HVR_LOCUS350 [uncultured virus]|nr:Hypothetical protein HVR_LOCUS350 [uncultured virus]